MRLGDKIAHFRVSRLLKTNIYDSVSLSDETYCREMVESVEVKPSNNKNKLDSRGKANTNKKSRDTRCVENHEEENRGIMQSS